MSAKTPILISVDVKNALTGKSETVTAELGYQSKEAFFCIANVAKTQRESIPRVLILPSLSGVEVGQEL